MSKVSMYEEVRQAMIRACSEQQSKKDLIMIISCEVARSATQGNSINALAIADNCVLEVNVVKSVCEQLAALDVMTSYNQRGIVYYTMDAYHVNRVLIGARAYYGEGMKL